LSDSKSSHHFSQISCKESIEMNRSDSGRIQSDRIELNWIPERNAAELHRLQERCAAEMMKFTANADQAPLTSQTELMSSAERNV
jgi:hypothetical protein